MTLTLRSLTSFIKIKETKGVETPDDFSGMVSYAQTKPYSCRLIAKSSMQESQNSHERIIINPMEGRKKEKREKLHVLKPTQSNSSTKVPVFVMLPLDTMTMGGNLNKPRAMNMSLMALRSTGVEGVMVDAWWGLVEKDGPMKYNWEGYAELVKMCQEHGLKLQVVMSFHQCGGNVGDSCSIPLPPWVLEEISKNPDLVYTDRSGRRNPEYISLGCDQLPVLKGRTPIQVYSDYMKSFRERFKDYFGNVIVEIQVGMGPGGELRYPSYPESNGTWRFPGNGEFQCYDKYMRASLAAAAKAGGKDNWGQGGPHRDGAWNSEYGQFFLEWYSGELLEHGDRILAAADSIYQGTGAKLSGKVAGIHWHYNTRSHAAELTEGYYNTGHRDGYLPIARMLAKNRVALNFTCMDMRDGEQPQSANCSTEGLVRQVKTATRTAEVEVVGENALERYDEGAYSQVLATSRSDSGNGLIAFTFLRMNKRLFEPENWRILVQFVKCMSDGGRNALPECDSSGTDHYVGFIKKNHIKKAKRGSTSVKMDICIPVIYLFHYRAAEEKSSTKHQNCHTQ